jgi:rhamnose transport system ATP-binding protein
MAKGWADTLSLRHGGLDQPVERLSGGNQQKVVLAKWLATSPRLLIIDEPTRGIDVGTKAEVHRLLSEQAAKGLAVLMVSSELPEVLGMADRVLVMREGRLVATLDRAAATQESVMLAATGQAAVA